MEPRANLLGRQWHCGHGCPTSGPYPSHCPPFCQFLVYKRRNWGIVGFEKICLKVRLLVKGGARMQMQVSGIQLLLIIHFAKTKCVWGERAGSGAEEGWRDGNLPPPQPHARPLKACWILAKTMGENASGIPASALWSGEAPGSLRCRDFGQPSREVTMTQRPPWCHA